MEKLDAKIISGYKFMDCGLRGGREDLIKDWCHGGREGLQEEKRLNLPKMMCPDRREQEQWGGTDPK